MADRNLRGEVNERFTDVHNHTALGQSIAYSTDRRVNIENPDEAFDHLLNMVDALEETVKILAGYVDYLLGQQDVKLPG